jgi:hypothetical protein
MWKEAIWINGKKKIKGRWIYNWCADKFCIILDSKDPITGQNRRIETYNDVPEWGKWKLEIGGET